MGQFKSKICRECKEDMVDPVGVGLSRVHIPPDNRTCVECEWIYEDLEGKEW